MLLVSLQGLVISFWLNYQLLAQVLKLSRVGLLRNFGVVLKVSHGDFFDLLCVVVCGKLLAVQLLNYDLNFYIGPCKWRQLKFFSRRFLDWLLLLRLLKVFDSVVALVKCWHEVKLL